MESACRTWKATTHLACQWRAHCGYGSRRPRVTDTLRHPFVDAGPVGYYRWVVVDECAVRTQFDLCDHPAGRWDSLEWLSIATSSKLRALFAFFDFGRSDSRSYCRSSWRMGPCQVATRKNRLFRCRRDSLNDICRGGACCQASSGPNAPLARSPALGHHRRQVVRRYLWVSFGRRRIHNRSLHRLLYTHSLCWPASQQL